MKSKIVKANATKETATSERVQIAENYSADGISVAHTRVKPGITTMAHHLIGVNEIYLIISGKGQVDVGDIKSTCVTQGDLVIIPAGESQRISNIGKKDLVFYASAPQNSPQNATAAKKTKTKRNKAESGIYRARQYRFILFCRTWLFEERLRRRIEEKGRRLLPNSLSLRREISLFLIHP